MLFQPYTYISPTYRFIIVHYTSHTWSQYANLLTDSN
jgi:hypothetical protein